MNTRETELFKLEEELKSTGKKLNALIQEYHIEGQPSNTAMRRALYQNKLNYLETEIEHLNRQLQLLKRMQPEAEGQALQTKAPAPQAAQTPQATQNVQAAQTPQAAQVMQPRPPRNIQPQPVFQTSAQKPREYEKMFGKSFMGVFASVLIFISLIIFATLVLPYLNDNMKLAGLYILSFGILGAGLFLYHKNKNNKFYIAVIGCGTGALYLSLLLSNLYFKVLSDTTLYCFILVWAVLVKTMTKMKNLVFQIIGQSGIFIATVLGTVLCVSGGDEKKFFVLTVFYLLSSCVFSGTDKAYLKYMLHFRKDADGDSASVRPPCYEDQLCSHICKSLNAAVFVIGFAFMDTGVFRTAGIILLMLYMLLEYYITFRETCINGLAFQMLTVMNTFIMIGFFNELKLIPNGYFGIFIYLAAIATLIYAEVKNARFKLYTLVWCSILAFAGCCGNEWLREHLYAYLTVVPFLLYGKWKNRKMYLNTGVVYMGALWLLMLASYDYSGYRSLEYFIMTAAVCAAFLHVCHKADYEGIKIPGYILMCLILIKFAEAAAFTVMTDYNAELGYISSKARLIAFFVIALMHLSLSKLEYFGTKKPVEWMMLTVNALLMLAGCFFMHDMPWQLPTIMISVLLFMINSKRLLQKHESAGYYVAFKYTVLMISILSSFSAENYIISICLLIFAIASIVAGFYKDTAAFRLYGLVLSMISVIKLILIDLHYDSTLESALSFFVCGVLCFIISFIYHKIDTGFKNKENSDKEK